MNTLFENEKPFAFIGLDPGASGAISALYQREGSNNVTPVIYKLKGLHDTDRMAVLQEIKDNSSGQFLVLEKIRAFNPIRKDDSDKQRDLVGAISIVESILGKMSAQPTLKNGARVISLLPIVKDQLKNRDITVRSPSSMVKLGTSYGVLKGIVIGLGIPMEEATPGQWQKVYNFPKKGVMKQNEWKGLLADRAKKIFPMAKGITQETGDSLLMANYCKIIKTGKTHVREIK